MRAGKNNNIFQRKESNKSYSSFSLMDSMFKLPFVSPDLLQIKHLTLVQRYKIATLLNKNFSLREIAETINVHPSTISRELDRNSGVRVYNPDVAHKKAMDRKNRPPYKFTSSVKAEVESKLRKEWSPEQIAGTMKAKGTSISHEWIYQHVYRERKTGGDLYIHLRWARKKRRKRLNTKDRRGIISDRISISERPEIVQQKARYGDWEADTIIGANHRGAILTLVERKSKYTMACKLKSRTAIDVAEAMINMLKRSPIPVYTITTDNGKELANIN